MKNKPNNIHFFDLDGTLWNIDSRVWIIDKNAPEKPLLRLDNIILNNILNYIYMKDDLLIQYNGDDFYISKELYNKILKKKKINIDNLGLSWVEFYNQDYINNSNIEFLTKNIKHIDKNDKIVILSGKSNRKRHSKILNLLRIKLNEIGYNIFKIYFISNKLYKKYNSNIGINKVYILLEHLVGVKIENNKFVALKQDKFNNVYFYDDEYMNIDYANRIQSIFDKLISYTDVDILNIINNRIKNSKLLLFNNLVTNNEINPFKTNIIQLIETKRYSTQIHNYKTHNQIM